MPFRGLETVIVPRKWIYSSNESECPRTGFPRKCQHC